MVSPSEVGVNENGDSVTLADVAKSPMVMRKTIDQWRNFKKTRRIRKILAERNIDVVKLYDAFEGKTEFMKGNIQSY